MPKIQPLKITFEDDEFRPESPYLCSNRQYNTFLKAYNHVVKHGEGPTPLHEAILYNITSYGDGGDGYLSRREMVERFRMLAESAHLLHDNRLAKGVLSHTWYPAQHDWHPWLVSIEKHCNVQAVMDKTPPPELHTSARDIRLCIEHIATWARQMQAAARRDAAATQTPERPIEVVHTRFGPRLDISTGNFFNEAKSYARISLMGHAATRSITISFAWDTAIGTPLQELEIPYLIADANRLDEVGVLHTAAPPPYTLQFLRVA